MRRRSLLAALAASALVVGTSVTTAGSAAASGLTTVLTDVAGAAPVLLQGATDLGAAPQQQEHVVLALKLRNEDQLNSLLAGPHASLTPAQFTSAYGPSPETVDAVTSWARAAGLTVTEVSPNRTLIGLSGSTAAMDAALGASTDLFRVAGAAGRTYRSIASTISLPANIAGQVLAVNGLSDLGMLHLPLHAAATPGPSAFGPKELASFYNAPASATGTGQQVAVIAEGQLSGVVQDLRTFEAKFGLPQVPVTIVGKGSADTAGAEEFDLDTQYSTGEAPNVSGLTIYDGLSLANEDILSIINRWVTDNSVKQASFSAGECELLAGVTGFTASLDQTLKQAAAQGQSLFVSSGDNGSFCSAVVGVNGLPLGVPSVEYPASSPYAVGVGGTTVLNLGGVSGLYTNEIAWYGGGGGLSYFEAKPSYQATAPLPARRGVPDVALDSDPVSGYTVIVAGTPTTIGGTSAAAPAWQGFWARAQSAKGGSLGWANPKLYGAPASAFHDIVLGANGLFPALPGYDYTTGRGTPDVAKLIASF
jgi:subtilase family serine protease